MSSLYPSFLLLLFVLAVLINPSASASYESAGCVLDTNNPNTADIIKQANLITNPSGGTPWTVQGCVDAVSAAGKAVYAGLANGGQQCYATNSLLIASTVANSTSLCSATCSDGKACGGGVGYEYYVSVYYLPDSKNVYIAGPPDSSRDEGIDFNTGYSSFNSGPKDFPTTNGYITDVTMAFCAGYSTTLPITFIVVERHPTVAGNLRFVGKLVKQVNVPVDSRFLTISFADTPIYIKKNQQLGFWLPSGTIADTCRTVAIDGALYLWRFGEFTSTTFTNFLAFTGYDMAYRYTVTTRPIFPTLSAIKTANNPVVAFDNPEPLLFKLTAPLNMDTVLLNPIPTDGFGFVSITPAISSFNLATGTREGTLVVQAADLLLSRTYSIKVIKHPALSSLTISNAINGETLLGPPAFDYAITNYSKPIFVSEYCTRIKIIATDKDFKSGHVIQVIQGQQEPVPLPVAGMEFPLNWGSQLVTVRIINVTTNLRSDYLVTLVRAYTADLFSLFTNPTGLIMFHRMLNYYPIEVGYSTNTLSLSAIPYDNAATLTLQVGTSPQVSLYSGIYSSALPLAVGYNPIVIIVRSTDNAVVKSYTINVHRLPSPDSLISFIRITDTPGALEPLFSHSTYSFTLVLNNNYQFTLDAQAQNPAAKISISDQNFVALTSDASGWMNYKYSFTQSTYQQGPAILKIKCTSPTAPSDFTVYTISIVVVVPTVPPPVTLPYTTTTPRGPTTTPLPTPVTPFSQLVGCYQDVVNNPNVTFADIITPDNLQFLNTTIRPSWTVQSCVAAANAVGRVYAGLTNSGANCYATNQLLLPAASTKVDNSNCNTLCTDNQACGGGAANTLYVSVYYGGQIKNTYNVGPDDSLRSLGVDFNQGYTTVNGDDSDTPSTNGYVTQVTIGFCLGLNTSPTISFIVVNKQGDSFQYVTKRQKTIVVSLQPFTANVDFTDDAIYLKKGQRLALYFPSSVGADICKTTPVTGSSYYWSFGDFASTDYTPFTHYTFGNFKVFYRYTVSTKPNVATLNGLAANEGSNQVRFTRTGLTSFSYLAPVAYNFVNITALPFDGTSSVASSDTPPVSLDRIPIKTGVTPTSITVRGADNIFSTRYDITIRRGPALQTITITDPVLGTTLFPTATNAFSYGVTTYTNTPIVTDQYCENLQVAVTDREPTAGNSFQIIKLQRSYPPNTNVPVQIGPFQLIIVRVTSSLGLVTDYRFYIARPYTASLSSITTNPPSLFANFNRATLTYYAEVGFNQPIMTINAVPYDPLAKLSVTVGGVGSVPIYYGVYSSALPLKMGINTVVIKIISSDAVTTTSYTINVHRLPSPNSKLSALTVSDQLVLDPPFSPQNYSYSLVLMNTYQFSLEAKTDHQNATIFFSDQNGMDLVPSKPWINAYQFKFNADTFVNAPKVIRIVCNGLGEVDQTIYRISVVLFVPTATTPTPPPPAPLPVIVRVSDAATLNGTVASYKVGEFLYTDMINALKVDASRITYTGYIKTEEHQLYFSFLVNPPANPADISSQALVDALQKQLASPNSPLRLSSQAGQFITSASNGKICPSGAVVQSDLDCPPAVESSKTFPVVYQAVIAVLVAVVCIVLFIIAYCVYRKRQDGMEALKRVGGFHNTADYVEDGKGRRSSFSNINTNDHSVVLPDHDPEQEAIEVELHGQKSSLKSSKQDSDD